MTLRARLLFRSDALPEELGMARLASVPWSDANSTELRGSFAGLAYAASTRAFGKWRGKLPLAR